MSFTTSYNEQHISYFYQSEFFFSILKFSACDKNIMTLGSAGSY